MSTNPGLCCLLIQSEPWGKGFNVTSAMPDRRRVVAEGMPDTLNWDSGTAGSGTAGFVTTEVAGARR